MSERRPPQRKPPDLSWLRAMSLAGQVGTLVVAGAVGGVFLGLFLDRRLGTGGVLVAICILLGVAGGAFSAYRVLSREIPWNP